MFYREGEIKTITTIKPPQIPGHPDRAARGSSKTNVATATKILTCHPSESQLRTNHYLGETTCRRIIAIKTRQLFVVVEWCGRK